MMLILCGAPASGKSTFASLFDTADVVSIDACTTEAGGRDAGHALFWRRIEERCAAGRRVVVDRTNLTATTRERLRQIAQRHGVPCHAVLFQVDWETALARDAGRTHPHDPAILARCHAKQAQAAATLQSEGYATVYRVTA